MAPLRRVIVNVHCALASETWNVVATLVIRGAPRLPTAATTKAMNSSEGTNSRGSDRVDRVLTGSSRS
jgi:hypothetical protein